MTQLSLFASPPPPMPRPPRIDTTMLMAMQRDIAIGAPPPFRKAVQLITLDNLKGQEIARRAIEIAVTGGHAIAFEPLAGNGSSWAAYDIGKMTGDHRDRVVARIERFAGEAHGIEAAEHEARLCQRVMDRMNDRCGMVHHSFPAVLRVQVHPLSLVDFIMPPPMERQCTVEARIAEARAHQMEDERLQERGVRLMEQFRQAVGCDDGEANRLLAIGRTIACMAGSTLFDRIHIAEAMSYFWRPPA